MVKSVFTKLMILLAGLAAFMVVRCTGIGCLFVHFLGIPCPGCGMTHAVLCCLRLDFAGAFYYHPMVFSLPLLFLYFLKDGSVFKNRFVDTLCLVLIAIGFGAHYIIKFF